MRRTGCTGCGSWSRTAGSAAARRAGLEWQDVDLTAGSLTVRRQLVQVGWEIVETTPKTDAGIRTVALDAGTVAALREHRKRQMAERMEWASAWVETGKVFTREDGSTLHPATITDRFHELVTASGLPPIRLHDLRHGAASLMLAAGVPMKVVQETLGSQQLDDHRRHLHVRVPDRRGGGCGGGGGDGAAEGRRDGSAHTEHTHRSPRVPDHARNPSSEWCAARESNPQPAD